MSENEAGMVLKVSVVMPSYNYGQFIANAIDSVLNQAGVEIDLVVVDDGSTDNTSEVLQAYKNRIRVYRQENAGASAAKNLGVEKAKFPFLAFLDADDWMLEGSLYTRCEFLNSHPAYDWVYGDWLIADVTGKIVGTSNEYFTHADGVLEGDIFPSLLRGYAGVNTLTPLFRTSDVRAVGGFRTEYKAAEDYDFYLRISRGKNVHYIPEAYFGVQRLHHSHLTSKPKLRYVAELEILKGYLDDKDAMDCLDIPINSRLANLHNYLAYIYSEEGNYGRAIRETLLSILNKPVQRFAYRFLFYTLIGRSDKAGESIKNGLMDIYSRIKEEEKADMARKKASDG